MKIQIVAVAASTSGTSFLLCQAVGGGAGIKRRPAAMVSCLVSVGHGICLYILSPDTRLDINRKALETHVKKQF